MSEQHHSEEWRAVNGYPGYEVSSLGSVRSVRKCGRARDRFGNKPKHLKALVLPNGYSTVRLPIGKKERPGRYAITKYKTYYLHRLVLEHFVGPCPAGMEGCHNDGNKSNNSVTNLRWDTPANNTADKNRHGTMQRGEQNGQAKLTTDQVRQIRSLRPTHTLLELAKMFGVVDQTISKICRGEAWRHVDARGGLAAAIDLAARQFG